MYHVSSDQDYLLAVTLDEHVVRYWLQDWFENVKILPTIVDVSST